MAETTCRYCGAALVCDEQVRTPSSAWSAPANEEPTRCETSAPGHAPSGGYVYTSRPDMTVPRRPASS